MNTIFRISAVALLAATLSACVAAWPDNTPDDPRQAPATKAELDYLRGELARTSARIQTLESDIGLLQQQLAASRNAAPSATQTDLAAVRDQMSALERQIQAVDSARANDRQTLYTDLSKKVDQAAKAISASRPAPSPAKTSQTGIEHVVQAGETLSLIAQAYGKKIADIKAANNLKSDVIRIGQKLFIPD